jgi:hypothetical protein
LQAGTIPLEKLQIALQIAKHAEREINFYAAPLG